MGKHPSMSPPPPVVPVRPPRGVRHEGSFLARPGELVIFHKALAVCVGGGRGREGEGILNRGGLDTPILSSMPHPVSPKGTMRRLPHLPASDSSSRAAAWFTVVMVRTGRVDQAGLLGVGRRVRRDGNDAQEKEKEKGLTNERLKRCGCFEWKRSPDIPSDQGATGTGGGKEGTPRCRGHRGHRGKAVLRGGVPGVPHYPVGRAGCPPPFPPSSAAEKRKSVFPRKSGQT